MWDPGTFSCKSYCDKCQLPWWWCMRRKCCRHTAIFFKKRRKTFATSRCFYFFNIKQLESGSLCPSCAQLSPLPCVPFSPCLSLFSRVWLSSHRPPTESSLPGISHTWDQPGSSPHLSLSLLLHRSQSISLSVTTCRSLFGLCSTHSWRSFLLLLLITFPCPLHFFC